uniref:recombinase family protein n=1 Tax=Agathobacter sp. TaxID=2021311 RepID=UPI004057AF5A
MGRTYGYIRSLNETEQEEKQKIAMYEMQIADRDIFIEQNADRTHTDSQFQKLIKRLKPNDLLYIKNFDVLGDSYSEIENWWRILTLEKKADIVLLDIPQIDTRKGKTEFGTLVSNIVLTMLRYVSDMEWSERKQRQKEGIANAQERGVKFGRPESIFPENFEEIYQDFKAKKIVGREAAKLCNVSVGTFYRKVNQRKEQEKIST